MRPESLAAAGPGACNFDAIELLEGANQAAGWACEFRQLDAGMLRARSTIRTFREISVLHETANRGFDIVGEPPAGMRTLIVSSGGHDACINGHAIGPDTAVLVRGGSDFHAITIAGADSFSAHIPESILLEHAQWLFDGWQPGIANDVMPVPAGAGRLGSLRSALAEAVFSPKTNRSMAALEAEVVSGLVQALADTAFHPPPRDTYHRTEKRRTLMRAREFIEANLGEPIAMVELCRVCGTSQRTLQRIFQRELEMSPQQYITVRRLNAVRRELKCAEPAETIEKIATRVGFSHMGRFSAAFRRQFGQLPGKSRRTVRTSC